MALTEFSDLYASVSEGAVNRVLGHIRRRRPSLFTYGTAWVAQDWRERLCKTPDVAPEVLRHGNPVVTVEAPLPLLGTGGLYGLDFSVQLVELTLDLSPQSVALPPQLGALGDQRFAITLTVCAGLPRFDERLLDRFPPPPWPPYTLVEDDRPEEGRQARDAHEREREQARRDAERRAARDKERGPIVLPTEKLECCCLQIAAVGHLTVTGPAGAQVLAAALDGLEIVDIEPDCLEANLEQYLWLLMQYVVLPRLRVALPIITLHVLEGLPSIRVAATPTSATVPHNPSIEGDQLKVYVDVEVLP